MYRYPPLALVAALTLAGCGKAPETTDNAMVNVAGAADVNGSAFNDQAPVIENAADGDTAAVTVVAVPKPAAGATAADAAPLVQASDIEDEIRAGDGIERVRYGEGWAWTRRGSILRTADRDGSHVAYFRPGQSQPFFVQQGDRAFAYQGDKPVRVFDRDGRASAPDSDRTREAEQAAQDARDRHDHAEQAREHAGGPRGDRAPPVATPTATPTPTPSPSPTTRGPRGRDRDVRPAPAATDTPSPRWREPQRTPNRTPDR